MSSVHHYQWNLFTQNFSYYHQIIHTTNVFPESREKTLLSMSRRMSYDSCALAVWHLSALCKFIERNNSILTPKLKILGYSTLFIALFHSHRFFWKPKQFATVFRCAVFSSPVLTNGKTWMFRVSPLRSVIYLKWPVQNVSIQIKPPSCKFPPKKH